MYVPRVYAEENQSKLHDFIEANSFGLLVSQLEGHPVASHLPFLVDRNAGQRGTLMGHMARANSQWRELEAAEALAVFSGPHAYISPTWYAAENVVPTWNYIAVHVYGQVTLIHDPEILTRLVADFVDSYERSFAKPWLFDFESEFARRLCEQVVGFRLEIARLEGKWKLGQNHPVERRQRAAAELRRRPGENSNAIAAAMESTWTQAKTPPSHRD